MPNFNLVDQPWIPCAMSDGSLRYFGLRETLRRSPEIREISDPSPLVTLALHRLLLAILHRSFGPKDEVVWQQLWRNGSWDSSELNSYFDRWYPRFDLFAADHPFYQVNSLDTSYAVPIARIAHELASGNNDTLFDHTTSAAELAVEPGQAARWLLSWQSFAPAGLQSFDHPQHRSAKAAPLVKGAFTLVRGSTLFQTLMLNMLHYNRDDEVPFPVIGSDAPSWERDEEIQPVECHPVGYLDLLTWQSRRMRLLPDFTEDGQIVVRRVVVMKGAHFPDDFTRYGKETMLAFRAIKRPKPGDDPWSSVSFSDDRAIWRDSLALFQSVKETRTRPKTLEWLDDLCASGVIQRSQILPVDVMGMCTDGKNAAKVLFWRHERLPLPLSYLNDKDLIDSLGLALQLAEETARRLQFAARKLAELSVAPASDHPGARKPNDDAVGRLASRMDCGRRFWSRLEAQFKQLLIDLPQDRAVDSYGVVEYGVRVAIPAWTRSLRLAAIASFEETVNGLESSPRTIKATARAENQLRASLRAILYDYLDRNRKEVVQ